MGNDFETGQQPVDSINPIQGRRTRHPHRHHHPHPHARAGQAFSQPGAENGCLGAAAPVDGLSSELDSLLQSDPELSEELGGSPDLLNQISSNPALAQAIADNPNLVVQLEQEGQTMSSLGGASSFPGLL